MRVAALLLAGGESRRMGTPKQLLDWDGEPLVRAQARALIEAGCDPVVVALGHRAREIAPALAGLPVVVVRNEDYRSGRATSVRAASAALPPGLDAVVVLNVDQPRSAAAIAAVIGRHRAKPSAVTRPTVGGRGGHPVVFAGRLAAELAAVSEADEGLRAVVRAHSDQEDRWETGDPAYLVDLNTPADVTAARPGRRRESP